MYFSPEELTLHGKLRGLPAAGSRGYVVGVGKQKLAFSNQKKTTSPYISLSSVVFSKITLAQ